MESRLLSHRTRPDNFHFPENVPTLTKYLGPEPELPSTPESLNPIPDILEEQSKFNAQDPAPCRENIPHSTTVTEPIVKTPATRFQNDKRAC